MRRPGPMPILPRPLPRNRAEPLLPLAAGFLLIWIPYVAGVGLQERFGVEGAAGPLLIGLSLLIAWPVSRWLRRSGYARGFGLGWRRGTLVLIAGGILLMLALRSALALFAGTVGIAAIEPAGGAAEIAVGLAAALAIGAVPALAEDILTRGFPLFAARGSWLAWALILLSAALYTANHLWRFDWGPTEQVRLFCMGIAYAVAAWRTQSLWSAFALHLGWNAGAEVVPVEISTAEAFRLATAVVHLGLAAAILVCTRPRRERFQTSR